MCKTRAYRYNCGHYSTRALSQCRGTYATPKEATKPMCLADPTLTVKVNESCRHCQYNSFCSDWEARIAAAQARQFAAAQLVPEDAYEETEPSPDYIESFSSLLLTGNDFGDVDAAKRERETAAEEVSQLQTEFYRQQWCHWQSFLSKPLDEDLPKRRSKAKQNAGSPLKNAIFPEDFAPDEFLDTNLERVGSDGPGDVSSDEGAISERSSSFDELRDGDDIISCSWVKILELEEAAQPEPANMLPDWGSW